MRKLAILSILAVLFFVSDVSQAVDKKIYSVADGENDPYNHYPNGTSFVMWTDYTSTSSMYRRRSVIQFDVSSVSNYTLRGAVLNIWGSSGDSSSTSVNIYYYANNSWGESSIPYASSLGNKLASVSVTKASDISVAPQYDIALTNLPFISTATNNLSLALVATSGYGSYFITRNGVTWNNTATKKPYLTFRTWGDTETQNGTFDDSLGSWNITGSGTAQVVENPYGDGSAAQLTAGSPVGITQILDTPQDAFYINFDYVFQTETGLLDVTLTDRDGIEFLVGQLEAGASSVGEMGHASFYVQNASYLYLDNVTLGLRLDGITGSQILLDNVEFSAVPEPLTVALLALGAVVLRRKR